eukprot:m51a1_g6289 putative protein mei2-like 4-like (670) ;mRNA; r:247462-251089
MCRCGTLLASLPALPAAPGLPVPLTGVRWYARAAGLTAQVTLSQRFENKGVASYDVATYTLLLDRAAAVTAFTSTCDGVTAPSSNATIDDSSSAEVRVFRAQVARLQPRSEVLVTVTYAVQLDVDDRGNPIFSMPGSPLPVKLESANPQSAYRSSFTSPYEIRVSFEMPCAIRSVRSVSALPIEITPGAAQGQVTVTHASNAFPATSDPFTLRLDLSVPLKQIREKPPHEAVAAAAAEAAAAQQQQGQEVTSPMFPTYVELTEEHEASPELSLLSPAVAPPPLVGQFAPRYAQAQFGSLYAAVAPPPVAAPPQQAQAQQSPPPPAVAAMNPQQILQQFQQQQQAEYEQFRRRQMKELLEKQQQLFSMPMAAQQQQPQQPQGPHSLLLSDPMMSLYSQDPHMRQVASCSDMQQAPVGLPPAPGLALGRPLAAAAAVPSLASYAAAYGPYGAPASPVGSLKSVGGPLTSPRGGVASAPSSTAVGMGSGGGGSSCGSGAARRPRGDAKDYFAVVIDEYGAMADRWRTTLMIKNIPNKYTQLMLLQTIDKNHRGHYDFFYLPIDWKNRCNVGYAFINMVCVEYIAPLFLEFHNKKWERFNSEKVCEIVYARIQGLEQLIDHFKNSSLLGEEKKLRPIVVVNGEQMPFPVGVDLRVAKIGKRPIVVADNLQNAT